MASVLEIIRGISQAAANAYDGALDEDGAPLKVGLNREEEVAITDRRVIDGFGVVFKGPLLCIKYQSEVPIKEVHDSNAFESEIESKIQDVSKFLKKEYKRITGDTLSLTAEGEVYADVQTMSRNRTWVQAYREYKIGGMDGVEDVVLESDPDRLDKNVKDWLGMNGNIKRATGTGMYGNTVHPGVKKPQNVKGKRDEEPKT